MNTQNILAAAAGLAVGYFAFREKNAAVGNLSKAFLDVDGLTYTLYKSGTKSEVENYILNYGVPKDASHIILNKDGETRLYLLFKSKPAKKVLQLMDQDHTYSEALKMALSEHPGVNRIMLEKELDLYI